MNGEAIGRYLNALRETKGLERKAATMAGIPFAEIRKEREISDEFREMEQDVRANIVEDIRAEVIRRGVNGVDKSVYYKGEVVGVEKQYSDSLLLALAKAHDPMFIEKKALVNPDGGPLKVVIQDFSSLSDIPDVEEPPAEK